MDRKRAWSLLGIALVVALLVRLRTIAAVFATEMPHVASDDAQYHLRRVLYGLRNHPRMLRFDPFVDFPQGALSPWPDGFDRILIELCRILVGHDASMPEAVAVVSLFMPLFSIVAVPLIYLLASHVYDRKTGAFAALVAAILPSHVVGGLAGFVDVHALETSLSLAPMLLIINALESRRPVPWGIAAGICMGVVAWLWRDAPVVWCVLYLGSALTVAGWSSERKELARLALSSMAAAHVVTAYLVSDQAAFAAMLAADLILFLIIGWWAGQRVLLHLLIFAALNLGITFALHIRAPSLAVGSPDLLTALLHFSPLVFVLPLAGAIETWRGLRAREATPSLAVAHVCGLAFLLLAIIEFRHRAHWVPPASILLVRLVHTLRLQMLRRSSPSFASFATTLVVAAFVWSSLSSLRKLPLHSPAELDALLACDWLRTHSPSAGAPYAVETHPSYGVLGASHGTIAGVCERPSALHDDDRVRYVISQTDDPRSRIIHETNTLKIVERVRGAVLTGTVAPLELAHLEADLRTSSGRAFVHRDTARADAQGTLRIRFPYADHVRVRTPSSSLIARVTNEDVLDGRTVPLIAEGSLGTRIAP